MNENGYKNFFHVATFVFLEFVRNLFSGLGLRRLYIIKKAYNFLFLRLKPKFVEINGNKIYLDSLDVLNLSKPQYRESALVEILKKEIKKGYNILDLGANIGYYTFLLADLAGSKGKVFAFEPSPENFNLLKKNVEANNYKNIILENAGVSDKTGIAKLYLYGPLTNSLGTNIYPEQKKIDSVIVKIVRLDDFFKNYIDRIDFIKIDIEGAEGMALKGMRNLLIKNKDVKLITEFAPVALRKTSFINPADYLKELENLGFTLLELVNNQTVEFKPVIIKEIVERLTPIDGACVGANIFCVR